MASTFFGSIVEAIFGGGDEREPDNSMRSDEVSKKDEELTHAEWEQREEDNKRSDSIRGGWGGMR